MSFKLLRKWLVRGFVLLSFLIFVGVAWVEYEMRRGAGTFTEQVDPAQFQPTSGPIAIINAQILAPDGSTMIAGQTVILRDGQIQAVGNDIAIPEDCQIIDGTGKFLIPGLVDSHIHFENTPNDALLYLANGVTQVRDMAGSSFHLKFAKEIDEGRLGPDLLIASQKIYIKSGMGRLFSNWTQNRINITSVDEAKQLAKRLKADGFDGIKIGHGTRPEFYWALEAESERLGIPMWGHIPDGVSFEDFRNSSQAEIAHVEELTKALNREFGGYNADTATEFLAFIEKRGPEVAQQMKDQGVWVTTTVWLMESIPKQKLELQNYIRQVEIAYANPALVEGTRLRQGWLPGHNSYESKANLDNPATRAWIETYWNTHVAAIRRMTQMLHEHGVPMMAGTDANTPMVVPGFSLHDELILLCEYGLGNAESLRLATSNPAAWHGEKSGKIAEGHLANLVLLNKNPLEDMAHIKTIDSVVVRGRLLNREQRGSMLAAVKSANDASRNIPIEPYQ